MIPHKETDRLKIRLAAERVALGVALLAAAGFWLGWYTAPSRLWLDVLPNAASVGVTTQAGHREPVNIYAFAWLIIAKLNNWPKDGAEDFPELIESFRGYITPKGEEQLVELLKCKTRLQELRGRQRNINLVDFFEYDSVTQLSDSAWRVEMRFEILERVGSLITKQPKLTLRMWFVNYKIDPNTNFWRLGFAGFENFDELTGGRCGHES